MSLRSRFGIVLLICSWTAVLGCGNKGGPIPTSAAPALPVPSTGPPATTDEALTFGKQLVRSLESKDRAAFDKLMRLKEFYARCLNGLGLTAGEQAVTLRVIEGEIKVFYEMFRSPYDEDGELKVLGARANNGRMELVLRLTGEGFNYIVCTVARFPDGAIAMEDLLFTATGEPLSVTTRRLLIPRITALKGNKFTASAKDRLYLAHAPTQAAVSQAMVKNDYAGALKLLDGLPQELQNEKVFALLRLLTASRLGDELYQKEVETFMRLFPGDPSLDILALQYWLNKRDWEQGLGCVDRLDRFVGGDAYLNGYRTRFLVQASRFDEAKASAAQLIKDEPTSLESYVTSAVYFSAIRDFANTVAVLKKGIMKLGSNLDFDVLLTQPDFAEFVKSKEFADFKKWNEARPK